MTAQHVTKFLQSRIERDKYDIVEYLVHVKMIRGKILYCSNCKTSLAYMNRAACVQNDKQLSLSDRQSSGELVSY